MKKELKTAITGAILLFFLLVTMFSAAGATEVTVDKVQVNVVGSTIVADFHLRNPTSEEQRFLLEMQVRDDSGQFLAIATPQQTCDLSHPENVHKFVIMPPGNSDVISLSTPPLPNRDYQIWAGSWNHCFADDPEGFMEVAPFHGEKYIADLKLGTTEDELPVLEPRQPVVDDEEISRTSVTVEPTDSNFQASAGRAAGQVPTLIIGVLIIFVGFLIALYVQPHVGAVFIAIGAGAFMLGLIL